ncbi:hypothetical protein T459_02327 [Capsicum annuum]|uniref:Uncharacterized protein n=2 Tax=Capsicum annuum TaxID=4072 RepID=A0A2G3AJM6_CAPAN|nr:hypothetical protein T459_02327 [Capsicum annuum]
MGRSLFMCLWVVSQGHKPSMGRSQLICTGGSLMVTVQYSNDYKDDKNEALHTQYIFRTDVPHGGPAFHAAGTGDLSFNSVMDLKYGRGTCNHSRTDAVVTKSITEASSPITFLQDSKHESQSTTGPDSILNGTVSGSSKSSELSGSTFSSSSGYSSDDFILMNPKIASNSIASTVAPSKFPPYAKPLSQEDYNDLKVNTSTSSTSQVSDTTDESLSPTVSLTKSPSIQVMERQGGYDLNRVPSSIFGSKSSTPNEWSAASDESLFSINVSLARDHGDHLKSGELPRGVELDRYEEISKSGKLISFRHSPAVKEEHTEKSSDTKKSVLDGNNLFVGGSRHKLIKKEQDSEEEIKLRGNKDYSTAIVHSEGNRGFRDSYNAIHISNEKESPPNLFAMFITKKRSPDGDCASIPVVAASVAALDGQAVPVSAQVASLVSGQTGNVALVSGQAGNVALVSG